MGVGQIHWANFIAPTPAYGHPSGGGDFKKFKDKGLCSPPWRGAQRAGWVELYLLLHTIQQTTYNFLRKIEGCILSDTKSLINPQYLQHF